MSSLSLSILIIVAIIVCDCGDLVRGDRNGTTAHDTDGQEPTQPPHQLVQARREKRWSGQQSSSFDMQWGQWSGCSNGVMMREASVDVAGTVYSCVQSKICQSQTSRPSPALWGSWEPWSTCETQTENPSRIRTRVCNHPSGNSDKFIPLTPQAVQRTSQSHMSFCIGSSYQTEACQGNPNPEAWSSWHSWSSWTGCTSGCSSTGGTWDNWSVWSRCISGRQFRYRECPSKDCKGLNWESGKCDTRPAVVTPLWSVWGQWSACQQGVQTRGRQCTQGYCQGDSTQSQGCTQERRMSHWLEWTGWSTCEGSSRFRSRQCTQKNECSGLAYQRQQCQSVVVAVWSAWGQWSSCRQSVQTRGRQCTQGYCRGDSTQSRGCTEERARVGQWLQWTGWSACKDSKRFRSRQCTLKNSCYGGAYQTQQCQSVATFVWSQWAQWSYCREGSQTRVRTCLSGTCFGDATERKTCTSTEDRTLASWMEWSQWSSCISSTRSRARQCSQPNRCGGAAYQTQSCSSRKVTHSWSAWGQWSYCQKGSRSRNRQCDFGNCPGDLTQRVDCSSIHGNQQRREWMGWSEWSSCESMIRSRHRVCSQTGECNGIAYQKQRCSSMNHKSQEGFWSSWSACSNGIQKRTRLCRIADFPCSGIPYQYRHCSTQGQMGQHGNNNMKGTSGWTSWSGCVKGVRIRTRPCANDQCQGGSILRQSKPCYMQFVPGQGMQSPGSGQQNGGWDD